MGATPNDAIVVGGRTIRITNPDRILYPSTGTTKASVITYYLRVAERLLPHIRRRPITRIRWPQGVAGDSFFEKQLPAHAPDWIERLTLEHSEGEVTYPLAKEPATLAWLAQQNALELHVPQWRSFGRTQRTDRLVLDLDPGPHVGLPECAQVALWLHGQLDQAGLSSVPVTSGSKGLHVYARWRAKKVQGTTTDYARALAQTAEQAFPALVTTNMSKRARDGKILIDWSQNNPAKTTITPYSLRGRDQPFVAAPREWAELLDPQLRQLSMADVESRLAKGDPLAALS
jgi:bifunctional non-homologous end joining protein LigD